MRKISILIIFLNCLAKFAVAQWGNETVLPIPGVTDGILITEDFDADGDVDLLFSGFDGQQDVSRIYFNQNGIFSSNNYAETGLPLGALEIQVADFNIDGLPDLLVKYQDGSVVGAVYYNSDQGFVQVHSALQSMRGNELKLAILDYNKDLYPDILVVNKSKIGIVAFFLENNGEDLFLAHNVEGLDGNSSLTFAVFQEKENWKIAWAESAVLKIFDIDPHGDLVGESFNIEIIGDVSTADFNRDGRTDFYLKGLMNGSPFHGTLLKTPAGYMASNEQFPDFDKVEFLDVDGDGYDDMIGTGLTGTDSAGIYYYRNAGGNFLYEQQLSSATTAEFGLTELDQTGRKYLVVAGVRNFLNVDQYFVSKLQGPKLVSPIVFPSGAPVIQTGMGPITLNWPAARQMRSTDSVMYQMTFSTKTGTPRFLSPQNDWNLYADTSIVIFPEIGEYKFAVRAINGASVVGDTIYYEFTVLNERYENEMFLAVMLPETDSLPYGEGTSLIDINKDGHLDMIVELEAPDSSTSYIDRRVYQARNYFESITSNEGTHLKITPFGAEDGMSFYLKDENLYRSKPDGQEELFIGATLVENYVVFDMDKDGDEDVLLDSRQLGSAAIFINNNGLYEEYNSSFDGFLYPYQTADMNGDGQVDVITKNGYDITIGYVFSIDSIVWDTVSNGIDELVVKEIFDFESDGDYDLYVHDDKRKIFGVFKNDGGQFKYGTTEEIKHKDYPSSADYINFFINSNGGAEAQLVSFFPDVIVVGQKNYINGAIFLGGYLPDYQQEFDLPYSPDSKYTFSKVADVDGDGILDVVTQYSLGPDNYQTVIYYGLVKKEGTPSELNLEADVRFDAVDLAWDTLSGNVVYRVSLTREDEVYSSNWMNNDGGNMVGRIPGIISSERRFEGLAAGVYNAQVIAIKDDVIAGVSPVQTFTINSFNAVDIPWVPDTTELSNFGGSFFSRPFDYENDGDYDFLFFGARSDNVNGTSNFIANKYLYVNQGDSTFEMYEIDIPGVYTGDVEFFDYNKDGYQDFAITAVGLELPNTHWEQNKTNGGLAKYFTKIMLFNPDFLGATPGDTVSPFLDANVELPRIGMGNIEQGDYNQDGIIDLMISGRDSSLYLNGDWGREPRNWFTYLLKGTINGFLVDTVLMKSERNLYAYFQDTDADGDEDVIVLGGDYTTRESVNMQFENVDGVFHEIETNLEGYSFVFVDFADYDRDGDADMLMLGTFVNNRVYYASRNIDPTQIDWQFVIYNNQGENIFSPSGLEIDATIPDSRIHQIHWLDVNNDGRLDIVLQTDDEIKIIEQLYSGGFSETESRNIEGDFTFSTYGDYNNDSRLDFIVGGRNNQYQVYFSNLESINESPSDPIELQANVINDEVTMNWNNSGDDLTPGVSLRYGFSLRYQDSLIYSNINARSSLSEDYQNGLLRNRISFKDLVDGTYQWDVVVVDDNFRASPLTAGNSFVIAHDPEIIGAVDTCQFLPVDYKVIPENQNYRWFVDSSAVEVLDSLTGSEVHLKWKKTGTHFLAVKNVDFDKWDTLEVLVLPNFEPYFLSTIPNPLNKTELRFSDTLGDQVNSSEWFVLGIQSEKIDSVHDFVNWGDYRVQHDVRYQNGCSNSFIRSVAVWGPHITGDSTPCQSTDSLQYLVAPMGFGYEWSVSGGEVVHEHEDTLWIVWDKVGSGTISVRVDTSLSLSDKMNLEVRSVPNADLVLNYDHVNKLDVVFQLREDTLLESIDWTIDGKLYSTPTVNINYSAHENVSIRYTELLANQCVISMDTSIFLGRPIIQAVEDSCFNLNDIVGLYEKEFYTEPSLSPYTFSWHVTGAVEMLTTDQNSNLAYVGLEEGGPITIIVVNDQTGDSDTLRMTSVVAPEANPKGTILQHSDSNLVELKVDNPNIESIIWDVYSEGDELVDTIMGFSPVINMREHYYVRVHPRITYNHGCSGLENDIRIHYARPDLEVTSEKVCSDSVVMFVVNPVGLRYHWDAPNAEIDSLSFNSSNQVGVKWKDAGEYTLTVNWDYGNIDESFANTLIFEPKEIEKSITISDSLGVVLQLPDNLGGGAEEYLIATASENVPLTWHINNEVFVGDSVLYHFVSSGEYEIKVSGETALGCYGVASEQISVSRDLGLIIFNLATPNEDGHNDALTVKYLERFERTIVRLFTLDGELLFESENYENDWRFEIDGEILPAGNYVCQVEVDIDGQIEQVVDIITVIRE